MQNHNPQDNDKAERFDELADRWEKETALLSNSSRSTQHPAHQQIVGMGEVAVPVILEGMQF